MSEQIIINIVRPEVGIEYRPETSEAGLTDRLAASELGVHALARQIAELYHALGRPCPPEIEALIDSQTWRRGM